MLTPSSEGTRISPPMVSVQSVCSRACFFLLMPLVGVPGLLFEIGRLDGQLGDKGWVEFDGDGERLFDE
ncbi:hypothetical protein DPMN_150021 [Dreissena polymorpha]|uniref:Uncharacterized protein n=1 Tax=Dreissena polymorpha TaxID=45954 RepID=A0A9D4FFK6_DREPO|nr:hypothetical protein DPMN_150021 [Dreissena polymorpha]